MRTSSGTLTAAVLLLLGAGCDPASPPVEESPPLGASTGVQEPDPEPAAIALTSSAFEPGAAIPLRHSAYGENVSPALGWSNLPEGTQSIALILDDPDAPTPEPFVHWVIYNIPASAAGLPEGLPTEPTLSDPEGAHQGPTGLQRPGYFGPRPPAGPVHNYHFRLFALSLPPNLPEGLGAAELRDAISGSVLGEATLIGTYQATE